MTYDRDYFEWQRVVGEFGGEMNRFKFEPFLSPGDAVLDFGCGGGYLLERLPGVAKAGVEINEAARAEATRRGLTVYESIDATPDDVATVIVSHHALEHVERPLDAVRDLRPKLRDGGRMVFVVPHQGPREAFRPDDRHQHLYTWNPATLGNLFQTAGLRVERCDTIRHVWPADFRGWRARLGDAWFHRLCRLKAWVDGHHQTRVVARKDPA